MNRRGEKSWLPPMYGRLHGSVFSHKKREVNKMLSTLFEVKGQIWLHLICGFWGCWETFSEISFFIKWLTCGFLDNSRGIFLHFWPPWLQLTSNSKSFSLKPHTRYLEEIMFYTFWPKVDSIWEHLSVTNPKLWAQQK